MSTPDPKTVREIARTACLLMVETVAGEHIVHRAMSQHFIGHDNVYAWSETYDRVLDELAAVLKPLTQPDEQQPAETTAEDDTTAGTCTMDCVMGHTNEPGCLYDTTSKLAEQQPADVVNAEQQQDGAVGGKGSERAASLLAFLDLHRERRGHDVIASLAVGDGRTVELTQVQLRAVLAERTALAARVAELESERDLWRTRAYQVGNMFIGERDPEVVPFLGVPGQEPAAAGTEES